MMAAQLFSIALGSAYLAFISFACPKKTKTGATTCLASGEGPRIGPAA